MSTLQDVYRHNNSELAKYRQFIRLLPKVVALYSADYALGMAMFPQGANYSVGQSPAGDRMVHDSSNAAWNWRIALDGKEGKPLYVKDKNHSSVGSSLDRRGSTDFSAAVAAVVERRLLDINGKLFSSLFSSMTAPPPKVVLYNNVDDIAGMGKEYARRANLASAAKAAQSYAESGAVLGYNLAATYMTAGQDMTPDPIAMMNDLKGKRGSVFVKEVG